MRRTGIFLLLLGSILALASGVFADPSLEQPTQSPTLFPQGALPASVSSSFSSSSAPNSSLVDSTHQQEPSPTPSALAQGNRPWILAKTYRVRLPVVLKLSPRPGLPLYFDNFSNPQSGWYVGEDAQAKLGYLNGMYQILIKTASNAMRASAPKVSCSDCAIEVDVCLASPVESASGIIFGITANWDSYVFLVSQNQHYSLHKLIANNWQTIVDWTDSPRLNPGSTMNRLRVVRDGARIELYANGQRLTAVMDSSLSGLQAGLIAESFDSPNVDARFDNFAVYPLGYASPSYTPTPTPTAIPGIYGRVTCKGVAAPGIELHLMRYGNAPASRVATTTTDSDGRYRFSNVPGLRAGEKYFVHYGPNRTTPTYVGDWYGPDITSYASGASAHGGDFDIANVKLLSPDPGAVRPLPLTFSWQRRGIINDTYEWMLLDPQSDEMWSSGDLGDIGQFTLTRLPQGAQYGREYAWMVIIYNGPDSYGSSYYHSGITFSAGAAPQAVP